MFAVINALSFVPAHATLVPEVGLVKRGTTPETDQQIPTEKKQSWQKAEDGGVAP